MALILEFSHSELHRLTKGELVDVVLKLKEKLCQFEDRYVDTKAAAKFLNRSEAWIYSARFCPKNSIEKRLQEIGLKRGVKKSSPVEYRLTDLKKLRDDMQELSQNNLSNYANAKTYNNHDQTSHV